MKRIEIMTLAAAVAAGVGSANGCQSPTFPDGDPTLEGEIFGIGNTVPFGSERTVWVKAAADSPCGIVFLVEAETDIGARQPDDSVEDRRFEDLAVGHRVRIWSGDVAESCPGQAAADAIEIVLAVAVG